MEQRNTFPLKLCALLLVKLNKMAGTGKVFKTSPTPKMRFFFLPSVPWRDTLITLENPRLPFQGESELLADISSVTWAI